MRVAYTIHVPVNGYQWVPVTEEMLLVAEKDILGSVHSHWNPLGDQTPKLLLRVNPKRGGTRVGPLEDLALFRTFAAMEPVPDQITAFANQYGSLWKTNLSPFSEWEFEIRSMQFLVNLWDASAEGDDAPLVREHFQPESDGAINDPFEPKRVSEHGYHRFAETLIVYRTYGQPRTHGFGYSPFKMKPEWEVGPARAARRYVLEALDARLKSTGAAIRFERLWSQSELTVQPNSLIGALWAQFAVAVSENKQFRKCGTCGRAFELTPDVARTSRFYCDDACRVKAYRQRKVKAQRLRAAGRTVRQIAGELESTAETVKKWLADGAEKKKGPKR